MANSLGQKCLRAIESAGQVPVLRTASREGLKKNKERERDLPSIFGSCRSHLWAYVQGDFGQDAFTPTHPPPKFFFSFRISTLLSIMQTYQSFCTAFARNDAFQGKPTEKRACISKGNVLTKRNFLQSQLHHHQEKTNTFRTKKRSMQLAEGSPTPPPPPTHRFPQAFHGCLYQHLQQWQMGAWAGHRRKHGVQSRNTQHRRQ